MASSTSVGNVTVSVDWRRRLPKRTVPNVPFPKYGPSVIEEGSNMEFDCAVVECGRYFSNPLLFVFVPEGAVNAAADTISKRDVNDNSSDTVNNEIGLLLRHFFIFFSQEWSLRDIRTETSNNTYVWIFHNQAHAYNLRTYSNVYVRSNSYPVRTQALRMDGR
eukprot:7494673-Ditylum_brightwellii.AAC.1